MIGFAVAALDAEGASVVYEGIWGVGDVLACLGPGEGEGVIADLAVKVREGAGLEVSGGQDCLGVMGVVGVDVGVCDLGGGVDAFAYYLDYVRARGVGQEEE